MNLRQKCKKLKLENEMLKDKIVPQIYLSFPYRITTLGTSNAVSVYDNSIPIDIMKRCAVRELADAIYPYVEFEIHHDEFQNTIVCEGRVMVAEKVN